VSFWSDHRIGVKNGINNLLIDYFFISDPKILSGTEVDPANKKMNCEMEEVRITKNLRPI